MDKTSDRFEVDVIVADALTSQDEAAWRALLADEPAFANPLFGPDFFRFVGRVRDDAQVAVFRSGGEAVAFLPFHRRALGHARPIGSPFSDYQALVAKGDIALSGRDALRLAGIRSYRVNGLLDPQNLFDASEMEAGEAHAIVLSEEPAAYLEGVRAASPKKFKNYRRLEHRLEREVGELRLVADDRSVDAFEQLIAWKRDQFRRTGLQDVLRPDWARHLMRDLFETPGQGLLISLYAGDTLVAGHFGIRSASVYHPWIASANPRLAALSPGQIFLGHAVRAMPALGLGVYDLGPGSDHYKRPYANLTHHPAAGLIAASGAATVGNRVYAASGLSKIGAVSKVVRRLDHIAAVDPSLPGVMRGLAEAAQGLTKRGLGNPTLSDAVA